MDSHAEAAGHRKRESRTRARGGGKDYEEGGSMNTLFLLMAQYNGRAIIPLDRVCEDFFQHLTTQTLKSKVAAGVIELPITRNAGRLKSPRCIHLTAIAHYLTTHRSLALTATSNRHGR